jgi:hypothetical protein
MGWGYGVQKKLIIDPDPDPVKKAPDPVKKASDPGSGSAAIAFSFFLRVLMKTTEDVM